MRLAIPQKIFVCLALFSPLIIPSFAEVDEVINLRELMSAEDFKAAGLEKLDPEELEFLQHWFQGFRQSETAKAVQASKPSGDDAFGIEHVPTRLAQIFSGAPETVESRISGEFRGWSGRTIFRLDNGQVWQQAEPGKFFYTATNPNVSIRKGSFGSYLLRIEGKNSSIRVRRLE